MKIKEGQTTITFNDREKNIINYFIADIVESFQKYHCYNPKKKKINCQDCPFKGLCTITCAEELATRIENGINYPSADYGS